MGLDSGTRLGPYEVTGLLGAGGMGEVYRARDSRLRRDVALKVLPEAVRRDPARRARFEHEARVLASLNHPSIAAIYGIEETEEVGALVLELVEGDTLASWIMRGPVPVAEALSIARQMADALDAAHQKGIVHRDLKPANISITSTGLVKLLDFGLAKIIAPSDAAIEETQIVGQTREGMVVGTAAYMSPEQARGQAIDKRTDIWAFGCVLYEMLTGRRLFEGDGTTDTLALLFTKDPDWSALPPTVPPAIRALLKRCLERDRVKRLGDVAAIRFALEDMAGSGDQPAASTPGVIHLDRSTAWRRIGILSAAAIVVAAVVLIAAAGLGGWNRRIPSEPSRPVRFTITLPPGQRLAGLSRPSVALSADASQLAYVATTQGEEARQIYLWSMERAEARPVPGTEGATNPFFSPDGQWLGFYSRDTVLTKVPVRGGVAQPLTNVSIPSGASWGAQRTIAFPPYLSVIHQLPEEGGAPQALTRFENGETQHIWPEFLPGSKALLFAALSVNATPAIAVQPIGAGQRRNLQGQSGTMPRYASSGHLVYAQRGNLMAVPFDLGRLEVKAAAVAVEVVPGVSQSGATAQYSLSATGSLAYVPGSQKPDEHRLVWVSRNGTDQTLNAPPRVYNQPRISPDGQRAVVDVIEGSDIQVWQYDLGRDRLTPFTYKADGVNRHGVWQPDSTRVVFMSSREGKGQTQLYRQSVDGAGLEQLTTFPPAPTADILPIPYSFCGSDLTFVKLAATPELWVQQMGDSRPGSAPGRMERRLSIQSTMDGGPQLSPDCRWVAYASDESGRREIFVRAYPSLENKHQISMDGGNEPLWNPDPRKRELFYRAGDRVMAVNVNDRGFAEGNPHELFRGPYVIAGNGFVRPNYDVSPDGQRFLMLKPVEREPLTRINVVLGWLAELKRLVPTG